MNKSKNKKSTKKVLFLEFLSVLIFGLICAFVVGSFVVKEEKKSLIDRVSIVSKAIYRAPILELSGNKNDLETVDYNYLKKKLLDIRGASSDISSVYLLGYDADMAKMFFYVDSEPVVSKNYSIPGEIYPDATEEILNGFMEKKSFAYGPHKDSRGDFVTAYAPILSPDTGQTVAMIAMDINSSKFLSKVFYSGAFAFLISVLFGLFIVTVYRLRMNLKNEEISNINMEFSYFMSHEIRGFLTKIKGGLSLLFEENFGKISPSQKTHVGDLLKQSEDFGGLIEEFLDISHLESDAEVKLKLSDCNVVNVIKGAVADNKESFAKKNIAVLYEGNLPEKFFCLCDSFKLQRVFSNLLLNSVKYSAKGSSISIGYLESQAFHTLSIKDQGIGIPALEQDGVFKKFFRASNARNLHYSGTGLGLYFSKLIIEHHHGKIWFDSTEGRGTTFFISLPKKIELKNGK